MPPWLAPVQAVVLNITDRQAEVVERTAKFLRDQGFRVETDLRNEKIGFKIREHTLQRIPYLLVVGDREAESGAVAVRTRSGQDLGVMSLDGFVALLASRSRAARAETALREHRTASGAFLLVGCRKLIGGPRYLDEA